MSGDEPVEEEDIVQELRNFSYIVDESKGVAIVTLLEGTIFDAAADEIDRLREMGDRMVNSINYLLGNAEVPEDLAELLAAWKASRVW